jgi:hypothetical protein
MQALIFEIAWVLVNFLSVFGQNMNMPKIVGDVAVILLRVVKPKVVCYIMPYLSK